MKIGLDQEVSGEQERFLYVEIDASG